MQLAVSAGIIVLFLACRHAAVRWRAPAWASPVLGAALLTGGLLWLAKVPVARFEDGAMPLRWALSPAIVALGGVVWRERGVVRAQAWPLGIAVAGGTAVGVGSALWLARMLGLGALLRAALATKTVSTPFAVAVAMRVGGPVPLAAALAVLTGVVGAVTVPPLLRCLGLRGAATTGIAIGVSSHLVGTDALGRHDRRAAAWSAVAMVLAGVLAALLLPLLWARLP